MQEQQQVIEQLSLYNWPALHTIQLDGWELRASNGYTKRANCVSTLHAGKDNIDDKIFRCEQYYTSLDQPTIFKLTSFSEPTLDKKLQQLNYQVQDPSLILGMNLEHFTPLIGSQAIQQEALSFTFFEHISLTWIDYYIKVTSQNSSIAPTLVDLMAAIRGKIICCACMLDNEPVAVAFAVVDQGLVSLYHVHTVQHFRNQGIAGAVISQLLLTGKNNGAHSSYLAVLANNEPAKHLYEKLGYKEIYSYWYRTKSYT